jgi:hypothetical protein
MSVIPYVIFNLNFQFNQKFSETAKFHRSLFNPLVILSVIFNLNFQFTRKFSETRQITTTTFQSIDDFTYKE